jgi:hypothetical protein
MQIIETNRMTREKLESETKEEPEGSSQNEDNSEESSIREDEDRFKKVGRKEVDRNSNIKTSNSNNF